MKIGMVLEGGAMRGMYTAGALDVWMAAGIPADEIVGVSAGALFGVNYLSGQSGRVIRYNRRFNGDRHYMGVIPLLREGNIISTKYAYDAVPHALDPFDNEAFRASSGRYFAVVTNVSTGRAEYTEITDVFSQMDVLRASASMPYVSTPVKIGRERYLDGGISDSIPYHWMADRGCDKLIVLLTQDITYRKTPKTTKADPYKLLYPAISHQLATRHERYNWCVDELKNWERDGRAFVLRPSEPIRIPSLERDPEKLQMIYDLGCRDAQAQLPALKTYLGI